MRIRKQNKQVVNTSIFELPEKLQKDLMEIHKMIRDACYEKIKDHVYADIANAQWAKTMLEEFVTEPKKGSHVGMVQVFKNGKKYSCMIQMTAHVTNDRRDIDHELFHDFIRNVHQHIKTRIRRKYNMSLECESEHGELFEAFDVWTSSKVAKELWEAFEARGIKPEKMKPMEESATMVTGAEMPEGIQTRLQAIFDRVITVYTGFAANQPGFDEAIYRDNSLSSCKIHLDDDDGVAVLIPPTMGSKLATMGIDEEGIGMMNSWINRTVRTCKQLDNELGVLEIEMVAGGVSGISLSLNADVREQIAAFLDHDQPEMEYVKYTFERDDLPGFLQDFVMEHCDKVDWNAGLTEFIVSENGHVTGRMYLGENGPDVSILSHTLIDSTKYFHMTEDGPVMEFTDAYARRLLDKIDPVNHAMLESVHEIPEERQKGYQGPDAEKKAVKPAKKKKVVQESVLFDTSGLLLETYQLFLDNYGLFLEASHGKVTTAFRIVTDAKTKHSLKVVYPLDGQIVDLTNKEGKSYKNHASYKAMRNLQTNEERIAFIKKNGCTDFASHGGKIIRIIDMNTNKQLQEAYCVGAYNMKGLDLMDDAALAEEAKKPNSEVYHIKVGEVEEASTFKSTFWPKNSKWWQNHMKEIMDIEDPEERIKKIRYDMSVREVLGVGKGAKLNDLSYEYRGKRNQKNEPKLFRHPKKYKQNEKPEENAESLSEEVFYDAFEDAALMMEAKNQAMDLSQFGGDMSPVEAKKTMASISQQIIQDPKKRVTQYTGNMYANIISRNLLKQWGSSYRKIKIQVDDYQSFHYVEFKIPKMTLDFVSRYIEGRESLEGFLHRSPEIKIKMSPRVFHTMKDPNDAYAFFMAAVRYYEKGAEKFARQILGEIMKAPRELKHLMSTTKLSGLLTIPMSIIFQFDDVKMYNRKTFQIDKEDIDAVRSFIRTIYTKYASPSEEKKQILKDMTELVKSFQETVQYDPIAVRDWAHFQEYATDLFADRYHEEMVCLREAWQEEQIDLEWMREHHTNAMFEKLFVKRLKKIPRDLVAYITIEGESIKDANDKMMIVSYCLSKIEIVEWYIQLIDAGDSRYIVPHDKKYLESLRTQLLAAYKKIMDTPIPEKKDPFTIDIRYPGKV